MENFNWCDTVWIPRMGYGIFHKGQPWMWYDASQIWMRENNEIELHVEKKPVEFCIECVKYDPKIACGTMKSINSFGYGIFSAEIQLPRGKNLWPAFWLVGEGKWPLNGEIDVVEAWSGGCNYFKLGKPQFPYFIPLCYWNTTTNVHWEENGEHKYTGSRRLPLIKSIKNPTEHFIKYEVEWKKESITFKIEGKVIRTYGSEIAKRLNDTRQFVIFDLWTTGEDFTCETPMKIRNFEYKPLEIL